MGFHHLNNLLKCVSASVLNINTRVHLSSRRTGCARACGELLAAGEQLPGSPALQPCGPQASSSGIPGPMGGFGEGQDPPPPPVGTQSRQGTGCHNPALSDSGRFCTFKIKSPSGTPALKKGRGWRAASASARPHAPAETRCLLLQAGARVLRTGRAWRPLFGPERQADDAARWRLVPAAPAWPPQQELAPPSPGQMHRRDSEGPEGTPVPRAEVPAVAGMGAGCRSTQGSSDAAGPRTPGLSRPWPGMAGRHEAS